MTEVFDVKTLILQAMWALQKRVLTEWLHNLIVWVSKILIIHIINIFIMCKEKVHGFLNVWVRISLIHSAVMDSLLFHKVRIIHTVWTLSDRYLPVFWEHVSQVYLLHYDPFLWNIISNIIRLIAWQFSSGIFIVVRSSD